MNLTANHRAALWQTRDAMSLKVEFIPLYQNVSFQKVQRLWGKEMKFYGKKIKMVAWLYRFSLWHDRAELSLYMP